MERWRVTVSPASHCCLQKYCVICSALWFWHYESCDRMNGVQLWLSAALAHKNLWRTCAERKETAFDKGSNCTSCTCAHEAHNCILKLMSNLLNYLLNLEQTICQCKAAFSSPVSLSLAISSWLSIPVSTKSLYICILHLFSTRHTRYPLTQGTH